MIRKQSMLVMPMMGHMRSIKVTRCQCVGSSLRSRYLIFELLFVCSHLALFHIHVYVLSAIFRRYTVFAMSLIPLDQIKEQLNTLLDEVASLRYMQNCYVPAATLPAEVIAYIFSFCLPASWAFENSTSKSFNTFVGYSQVCTTWRTAALGTPSLWTMLPCGSHARTKKILERAEGALLSVKIEETARRTTIEDLLEDMSRIRSLEIVCRPCNTQFLTPFLTRLGPNIEILDIDCTDSHKENDWEIALLGNVAPRLIKLTLSRCTGLLGEFQAPLLQRLSLTGGRDLPIPVAELLAAVRGMSGLEAISLAHMTAAAPSPAYSQADLEAPSLIRLPHLKTLVADGSSRYILPFVLSLNPPALNNIHLSTTTLHAASYKRLFRSQPVRAVLSSFAGKVSFVKIHDHLDDPIRIGHMFEVLPKPTTEGKGSQSSAQLRIDVVGSSTKDKILGLLLSRAAKIKTETLEISLANMSTSRDTWLKAFGRTPFRFDALSVSGIGAAAGLIDALGFTTFMSSKGSGTDQLVTEEAFFLENLRDLWFEEVNFDTLNEDPPQSLLDMLKEHLKFRAETCPKWSELKLHIADCTGFDEDDDMELQDAGWEVHWDGNEGASDEGDDDDDCDCDCCDHRRSY
jgi:hypothetical protein